MIKNCLVCGEKLHRSKQHGKHSSPKRRVGKNQITCGGNCGKIYDRIMRHIIAKPFHKQGVKNNGTEQKN